MIIFKILYKNFTDVPEGLLGCVFSNLTQYCLGAMKVL